MDNRRRGWGVAALLLITLPAWAGADGRWRLIEQTYQRGGSNLAPVEAPLRLELVLGPDGPQGRIWSGDDPSRSLVWPAFLAGESVRPVTVLERSAQDGEVAVRYRVQPAPGDDLVLEISERYRASASGDALEGTVEVRFTGGSRNRGGYTLHRRFERER